MSLVDQAAAAPRQSLVDKADAGRSLVDKADTSPRLSLVDRAESGFLNDPATSPNTTGAQRNSLLGGGFASGKGNFWKGAGKSLNILENEFGFETGLDEKMMQWSDENMNDASVNREGLLEDVIFTAGQVAVPVAAALTAAAVSPFLGLSAAVGAGVASFATSWGMNAGDFFSKEEMEDPDFVPTLGDVGITGLLAAPDLLGGGAVRQGAKLFKPLADVVTSTAAKTAANTGMDVAQATAKLPGYIKGTAEVAFTQGTIEGVQDFSGSIAASIRTDSELDATKIETLGRAAAYEALVGTILGVPLGGLSVQTQRSAIEQQRINAEFQGKVPVPIKGEDGGLSLEFQELIPVDGAVKQPGMFTLGVQTLMGNSTDKLRTKFSHMPKAVALLDNFAMTLNDRGPGKTTFNEDSRALEGELQTLAKTFNKSNKSDRKAAWEGRANGTPLDTPAGQSLDAILSTKIPELASSMGIDVSKGLFTDPTYLPIMNNFNFNKASKSTTVLQEAEQDMRDSGKSDKQIESTLNTLRQQMKSYEATGYHMSYSLDRDSRGFREEMLKNFNEKREKGKKLSEKNIKTLRARLLKKSQSTVKESPLTLERSLKNLSQSFFNKYQIHDDPLQALNSHIRMVSEHLSLINRLGEDNKLFDEAIFEIAADAHANDLEFNADDVSKFYDLLKTQQRIHLKPIENQSIRKLQQQTRAVSNTMLLGLSALVSIPESLVIFMNAGGKNALIGLLQSTVGRAGNWGLASEQLGYTIQTAVGHGINRTGEESFEVGTFENAFIRWTGLPYLQHFLTVWSARSNDVQIKSMLKQLNDGGLTPAKRDQYNRMLQEASLDVDKAMDWAVNGFKEDTPFFKKEYVPAVVRLTQDTIVDPHPVDKPLWMNNEHLLLLTQLKGFMTVFTNRVMRSWKQKVAADPQGNRQLATKVAPYVAMYLAAQIGMQAVREMVKGDFDLSEWDEKEMSDRILASMGYLGSMAYLIDTYNSLRYNSNPLASALGPVPSKAISTVGGAVQALDRSDPEAAMYSIIKDLFPNVPFKDLMLEAIGVE